MVGKKFFFEKFYKALSKGKLNFHERRKRKEWLAWDNSGGFVLIFSWGKKLDLFVLDQGNSTFLTGFIGCLL